MGDDGRAASGQAGSPVNAEGRRPAVRSPHSPGVHAEIPEIKKRRHARAPEVTHADIRDGEGDYTMEDSCDADLKVRPRQLGRGIANTTMHWRPASREGR